MPVNFINRTNELGIAYTMVRDGTERVLFFYGGGGLGKTRLMQEIPRHLHNKKVDITYLDIVDFDDMAFHMIDNLVQVLVERLPNIASEDKASLYNELEHLHYMEKTDDSQKSRDRQGQLIIQKLADIVNKFHQTGKPVLFRFDTIEKMSLDIHEGMALFIHKLNNAFVIFSGRMEKNAPIFWDKLKQYDSSSTRSHEVLPLNSDAQKEYLIAKTRKLHINLLPQDVKLLLKLSRGRPIIIDLAVEYFARTTELGTGLLHSPFKQENEFESRLVKFVTMIHTDMERLILVLSRVYPLSSTMIADMLNVTTEEGMDLLAEAQTYVFIKLIKGHDRSIKITLHDEFRRMVLTYVWPEMDADFGRRMRDSQCAKEILSEESDKLLKRIDVLKPQIDKSHPIEIYSEYLTCGREEEVVREEQLRHALYADFSSGFAEWETTIKELRSGKKRNYFLVKRLLQLMRPYIESDKKEASDVPLDVQLTAQQHYRYNFIETQSNQDVGRITKAEAEYLDLLHKAEYADNTERVSQISNMLGILKRDLGEYEDALMYQERCLALQAKNNYWAIANVQNSIGYIYLLQKDMNWENLDKARERFEQAGKLARKAYLSADSKHKIEIKDLVAAIKNNLGYIYGLKKEFNKGETYCKDAIELWKEIEYTIKISWAKINLGVMARDQRQYQHAIQRLKEAIFPLDPRNNFKELCNGYLQLGWTQWFIAAIDSDREDSLAKLREALHNLEKSLKFAIDYEYNTELPDIYHQLASVYWELSKRQSNPKEKLVFRKKARDSNKISIDWSIELKNNRYFVGAWTGEMEFDYDSNEYDRENIEKQIEQLKPYENYGFPLYFGRIERILGDWAYSQEDFKKAFSHYSKGIPLINQHGGYGPYKIEIELMNLSEKLKRLPDEMSKLYLNDLQDTWKDAESQSKWRVDLIFWIEEQIDQIQILD